ncbi:MAG TPA: CPBP family intramembrane glutamic endopeptidase [Thermomicrobiaceae bacterium]|nr:CPBP family intramembrane glutamic endopeptidase [Thermomicrobiaceae bacterium]
MGADIATFVLLMALGAVLSAWAHAAESRRGLSIALYVAFGGAAVLIALAGVAIMGSPRGALGVSTAVGWVLVASALGIALPLLPPVRKLLSLVTPLDPHSITDAAGLSVVLAFVISNLGAAPLVTSAGSVSPAVLVMQDATFVVLAFIAVGTFMTRDLRCAVQRLGLVVPTRRQVLIALGLVLVAFAISIAAALGMRVLQPGLSKQISSTMQTLIGNFQSLGGALILGISAGIGEEILFRGALQPRYGVVLTSLFFAAVHVQYGFSLDVLAVFLMGIVLGLERKRFNTTSSIITHVVYDVLAVLAG